MNFNDFSKSGSHDGRCTGFPIRIVLMRLHLTLFLLIALGLQTWALPGIAQRVSIKTENAALSEVFQIIRQQTGYDFVMGTELVNMARPVNLNMENAELTDVLDACFAGQPMSYAIHERTVVVKGQLNLKLNLKLRIPIQVAVTGRITDAQGNPIPGVSVQWRGSASGQESALSDENGDYTITIPRHEGTLRFTHVAYTSRDIGIAGRIRIDVVLEDAIQAMDETIIIAYGRQERKNITGAVTTISGDQIADLPAVVNIEESLKGLAAGVMVQQETGQPGSATRIRIRGSSSLLGSNQPLYVVDGVPMSSEANIPDDGSTFNTDLLQQGLSSPLNNLNPSDIETMTVLKDASATAIYGSRAANGVVIITTKSGSLGERPRFSFSTSLASQQAQTQSTLNADQFREIWTEAAENSTSTVPFIQQIRDGSYFGTANTNWEDEVSIASPITQHVNLAVEGGGKTLRYYVSAGHNNNEGTFRNAHFRRYNFLSNLSLDVSDAIRVGTSLNLSTSEQGSPHSGLLSRIYVFRPDIPVFNPDGSYTYSPFYAQANPVALSHVSHTNNTLLFVGSLFAEARFAQYFNFRTALSLNYNMGNMSNYYPSYTNEGGFTIANGPGDGYGQESVSQATSHLWENTLTYNRNFGGIHALDAVVGASWQGDMTGYLKASGRGFPQDEVLNNLSSATTDFLVRSDKTQSGLASYFGRVNYTLMDRYILMASARTDASSKFASDNQWAFFPTGAVGWRLSEEPFLRSVSFLDELKVRASIGVIGQQNFGPYQWRSLFEASQYGGQPAVTHLQLGNSRLRWELTTQTDIGLDFSLFNNRLYGVIDYYEKLTDDLHYFMNIPRSTGFAQTVTNLGTTRNRGLELTLAGDLIRSDVFTWNMSMNVTRNRNTLVKLNDDFLNETTGVITPPNTGSILKVGHPIGLIWGYVADGIIQTTEQLDALNAGAPDGVYRNAGTAPGDILFKDINGPDGVPDGEITALDQTVIGNAAPDFWGGFSNTFRYRNLRLTAQFNYSVGNDLRWGTQMTQINFATQGSGENKWDIVMNRWTPENPTDQPRAVYGDPNGNALISSYYVHDASFLRLNNLYLEYGLPQSLLDRSGFLDRVQFYVSARNLLTFTRYPGPNPETTNLFNNDVSAGLDNSRYPAAKTFTFGIKAGF